MKPLSSYSLTSIPTIKRSSIKLLTKSCSLITVAAMSISSLAQTSTVKNEITDKENKEHLEKADLEKLAEADKAEEDNFLDYDEASIHTRRDARTMSLAIPAPRGQITDRFGYPFAQTKIIWYPAIQMDQFEDESDEFIIQWCREKIAKANELFGCEIDVKDKELVEHYRHRRWIPMPFKYAISTVKKDNFLKQEKLFKGIILHPIYQRVYPQKASAAHIIGYVGSKSLKLEKGPINYGDPLFWELEGRGGLEKHYNETLSGIDGQRKLQYDSHGREVRRQDFPPKPGGTVVTTIDLEWQKRAERVLKRYSRRGSFVVIDIETGEILVMASRPSYDLNLWVPYMDNDAYKKLLNDKSKPLYARAFQGLYPPASAFKVVTGIAALETKAIYKNTKLDCPKYIKLGNHKFWDWSKASRGPISINYATTMSNNPFFIQAALKSEKKQPGRFMTVASLLGYGKRTGLPLDSEAKGNLLSNEYTLRKYKRTIKQGDIANSAIGQGPILASPLQVAQSMAGIANDGVLPKLHLIRQVQNNKGVITMASKPQDRDQPTIDPKAVHIVKQGMYSVVNEKYGTGRRGSISYALLCGKTGTAQWGPKGLNQNLAWFAGYFPHKNPKYAFAVLYEGAPGEKVSGGKSAAPMVPAFFNPLQGQAFSRHRLPNRAMIVDAGLPDDLVSPLGDPDREPAKALIVGEDIATDKPPKAMIVEDLDEPEAPNVLDPENTLDPSTPIEPSNNDPLAPALPAEGLKPPKALIIEEPTDPAEPPLRELPPGVVESEEPAGEPNQSTTAAEEPSVLTEPVEPPKPPKAIPVE